MNEFDANWDACLSCEAVRPLDTWGMCARCSFDSLTLAEIADEEDESTSLRSLADCAFGLEEVADDLKDLGFPSIANRLLPIIREIDKALSYEFGDAAPLSKKQQKNKKKVAADLPATKKVAPVIELKRALPRGKEA
jgi:hypothetical protein